MSKSLGPVCPLPDRGPHDVISLAHGEGGRLMRELIARRVLPRFENSHLVNLGDGAVLPPIKGSLVFTTDSFVVSPLEFPGGDIGTLAVYGTVNDLAVSGALPRWISLSLILEEGLPIAQLERILESASQAARRARVQVVTGDTKVVPRGAADGMFINTAGIGEMLFPMPGPKALDPGDELIVSGPIGRHGVAVLLEREQLAFESAVQSDCAPLTEMVDSLHRAEIPVKTIRDATRGGVAAVLHEWSDASKLTLRIDADSIPVTSDVRGVCELLGLDPLHVACEGTLVAALPAGWGERAVEALRRMPECEHAMRIGSVTSRGAAPVTISTSLGQEIPLDEPAGAPLPRIC